MSQGVNENQLNLAQKEAETYLKDYCNRTFERWSKYLENANIETGFVDLQIYLMDYTVSNRITPIESYEMLFEDTDKQEERKTIIITGELWCGKSTYVNKLAFDWVKCDPYLRKKFDLVLMYDFSSWKITEKHSLSHIFSTELHNFVANLMDNSSKILIIFDNVTEAANSEQLDNFQCVLKHEIYPNATLVITTQRYGFSDICPQYVWIDGFSESAISDFLRIQNCQPNYNELIADVLQLPLSCALFCTLQRVGCSTSEATDLFDLIKCYVDHTVQKYFETSGTPMTKENVKQTLMLIGKYCFVHLIDKVRFEKRINDLKSVVSENPYDCQSLRGCKLLDIIGLFTKTNSCKKYEVLHKSIADYLAAYYIANILNFETHFPNEFPWFEIPLTEYLYYHILFLWEEGEFGDRNVGRILKNGETCLPWFTKRPSAFDHLPNQIGTLETLAMYWSPSFGRNMKCFKNLRLCQNLQTLILHGCNIGLQSAKALAEVLNSDLLPNLDDFILNDDLSVGKEVGVFEALGKLGNLKELQLCACYLKPESVKAFINQINLGNLANLEMIVIIKIVDFGSDPTFFSSIAKCPKLRNLTLKDCVITPEAIKCFVDAVKSNSFSNLRDVDLSKNKQIGGDVRFFSSLVQLPMLNMLCLKDCDISSACLQILADHMRRNKFESLTHLDVSCNESVGKEMSFISAVGFCQCLKNLIIYKCNLPAEAVDVLSVLRNQDWYVKDTEPGGFG